LETTEMPPVLNAIASAVALALSSYALGASGVVPRITQRLHWKAVDTLRRWRRKPANHPARKAAQVLSHVVEAGTIARAFVFNPRHTTHVLRQYRAVHPRRQPQELKDAVAEAARLHVPGKQVTLVRFAVFQPECVWELNNVAFYHGHTPEDVTRCTLGGNPVWFGSRTEGQGSRTELTTSRDRVEAALKALPIGPDIHHIIVPLDRKDAR
jgi:hypothetical protein